MKLRTEGWIGQQGSCPVEVREGARGALFPSGWILQIVAGSFEISSGRLRNPDDTDRQGY